WFQEVASKISPPVNRSDEFALLAVQGPEAVATCQRLWKGSGGAPLTDIGSFHFGSGELAGRSVTAARTRYTGEDGFELFCRTVDATAIWNALHEAGVKPCGLGARDTLRLEACLSLYGNDIDETTSPLEAGLAWVVKFDAGDFVGKAALERQKQ